MSLLKALLPLSFLFSQDQFDNLEKYTQWGIEFVERYTKFVKERSEIELSYAKQIRYEITCHCKYSSQLRRFGFVLAGCGEEWQLFDTDSLEVLHNISVINNCRGSLTYDTELVPPAVM